MATTPNSAIMPQTPMVSVARIQNADASTQKTVVTGGANGTKLNALTATSDDTSARIVQVSLLRSAVNYILGSVSIPAGSGTDGSTPAVDLLNAVAMPGLPVDNDGQKYLFLKDASDSIQVKTTTTVTSAKTVAVVGVHGDF